MSSGLLELVTERSELAFVLAHEIGHLVLHSPTSVEQMSGGTAKPIGEMIDHELEADLFALTLLEEASLDPKAAVRFLNKVSCFGSENGLSMGDLYPTLRYRVAALRNQLEG